MDVKLDSGIQFREIQETDEVDFLSSLIVCFSALLLLVLVEEFKLQVSSPRKANILENISGIVKGISGMMLCFCSRQNSLLL